jgi:hypothetical protein
MWPNPASDLITISMEDHFLGEFKVVVKNTEGMSLLTRRCSDEKLIIHLGLLKGPGIYFVTVITMKGILTKKLLVLR